LTGTTPQRRPEDVAFSWALGMVALLPRLFVAIAWSREPVWDGHYYHLGASRIAAGLGYSEDVIIRGAPVWKPWTHYPVGYSAVLGLFYRLVGEREQLLVGPLLNALLGAATALLVHRIALRYVGTGRARVAGALSALHPGLIAYCPLVMTEIPSAFLLVLLLWTLLRFRGTWHSAILGGLILGVLTLIRPASLLLAPLLLLCEPRPIQRGALRSAAMLGIALAVVMPWTIRNCVRMDGCALVSTNGGWNLAIGAITETGRFQTGRTSAGRRSKTRPDIGWAWRRRSSRKPSITNPSRSSTCTKPIRVSGPTIGARQRAGCSRWRTWRCSRRLLSRWWRCRSGGCGATSSTGR